MEAEFVQEHPADDQPPIMDQDQEGHHQGAPQGVIPGTEDLRAQELQAEEDRPA